MQHREGKTIVAPYSPRGNEAGLIATPLNWDEVNDTLKPTLFTIPAVLERLKRKGDPFRNFRHEVNSNNLKDLIDKLK